MLNRHAPDPGAEHYPLDAIFKPKTVAVIGATEAPGSVGRTLLWNLLKNPFGGTIYPVNPRRSSVLGIQAYPSVGAVPERVDLAVVVTPAPTVPDVIRQCADAGVPGAIIISAGFKELGPSGEELEEQILLHARRSGMRVVGPNCLGVMNLLSGMNATFAASIALPGRVAFLSQSGALCTAVLDWSLRELVGFSAFVSVGSMLDIGWGDLIDYLGNDPRTTSILIYMESIGDARSFLSSAREVALTKPIIVIKGGRTAAAAKAAMSHTGALAGSDEVLDAAFRRAGVLRVDGISDLFSMAEVLAKQPRPKGPRLTILTNAGGPAVLATDALIRNGGELAPLEPATVDGLNKLLPPHWSRGNPIDILGDAGPDRYASAIETAAKDPNSDGLLIILTPQDMTDPTRTAEALKPYAKLGDKPVLASWMGGAGVAAGDEILNRAGIPTFLYPDTAAAAFLYMWRYTYNLRGIYETPASQRHSGDDHGAARSAASLIAAVGDTERTLLDEVESKQLLALYGIPTVRTDLAVDADAAAGAAEAIGYPVVLKLYSRTITHKTEVGGVKLQLADADAVRRAFSEIEASVRDRAGKGHFQGVTVQPMVRLSDGYEIILGSSIDSQFGPVLLFGAGGQLVEVFKDRALSLPPLNATLARRMMEQTKIYKALGGVRGRKPVDLAALEQLLARFSQLIIEQPRIREIDLNPLLVSADRVVALDARVVLFSSDIPDDALPRPVIRPYPTQYAVPWVTTDGKSVLIRPIRPEDEPLMVKFHQTLSERSVEFRYFHVMKLRSRVAHERLSRLCFIDYDREMALVVERGGTGGVEREIVGIGRLSKRLGGSEAELGLIISDLWQRRGLGTELTRRLLQIARQEGIGRVSAVILAENREMQSLCAKLGFHLEQPPDDNTVRAQIEIV